MISKIKKQEISTTFLLFISEEILNLEKNTFCEVKKQQKYSMSNDEVQLLKEFRTTSLVGFAEAMMT